MTDVPYTYRKEQKTKAMNHHFPGAHAYSVPPSILHSTSMAVGLPLLVPFDVYINRYLSMWIMPCNHVTHALFFGVAIGTLLVSFWIPNALELLALSHQEWEHLGTLDCYAHECPPGLISHLWNKFYAVSSLISLVLFIAWRRVFRRFGGRPWMDPNFTEDNRLPVTTSNLRLLVDEDCSREVACRPELVATASMATNAGGLKTDMKNSALDLAPNVWNMDGEKWSFQLRNNVQSALDFVTEGMDHENSSCSMSESESESSSAA